MVLACSLPIECLPICSTVPCWDHGRGSFESVLASPAGFRLVSWLADDSVSVQCFFKYKASLDDLTSMQVLASHRPLGKFYESSRRKQGRRFTAGVQWPPAALCPQGCAQAVGTCPGRSFFPLLSRLHRSPGFCWLGDFSVFPSCLFCYLSFFFGEPMAVAR